MTVVACVVGAPRALEVLLAALRLSRPVGELAEDLGLDASRVSQCLGDICDAGLLTYEQHGREHRYKPSPNVWMQVNGSEVVIGLRSSCGSDLVLRPTADALAELVRGDRRKDVPFRSIPAQAEVSVVTRAAAHAPRPGAP